VLLEVAGLLTAAEAGVAAGDEAGRSRSTGAAVVGCLFLLRSNIGMLTSLKPGK